MYFWLMKSADLLVNPWILMRSTDLLGNLQISKSESADFKFKFKLNEIQSHASDMSRKTSKDHIAPYCLER